MSYRLIIDCPNGSQLQSRPTPVDSRHELGLHAMQFIGEQVPGATIGEGKALGRAVRDAPLGVTVYHEPTGYRFTVKEF